MYVHDQMLCIVYQQGREFNMLNVQAIQWVEMVTETSVWTNSEGLSNVYFNSSLSNKDLLVQPHIHTKSQQHNLGEA